VAAAQSAHAVDCCLPPHDGQSHFHRRRGLHDASATVPNLHQLDGRDLGRPPKHDPSAWTITDDWPDPVPVTDAELDVFEAWFGDLFDELFEPGG
jgi:hypothetical protein